MAEQKRKRLILMVASQGGHWVQLRRLAPAFEGWPVHYVATTASVAGEVKPAPLTVVRFANLKHKVGLLRLAWDMFRVVAKTRPCIVISTGAAPGYFGLVFGKLFGAKTIWIDSLANAEQMSVSGAKVKRFADLWLTQWPELASDNGPAYKGSIV